MPVAGMDDCIRLMQAVTISGVTPATLRAAALSGRLRTVRKGREVVTTRRNLEQYLLAVGTGAQGTRLPLPRG